MSQDERRTRRWPARGPARWSVLLIFAGALWAAAGAAGAAEVDDLIKMKQAGLGDDMLVMIIENKYADYIPSAIDLVKFNNAGFSKTVIKALLKNRPAKKADEDDEFDDEFDDGPKKRKSPEPLPKAPDPPAEDPAAPLPGGASLDPGATADDVVVEIKPDKKVKLRFPFNKVVRGKVIVFSSVEKLPPIVSRPQRKPEDEQRRQDFVAAFNLWLDQNKAISRAVGVRMNHALTEHCSLHFSTPYDRTQTNPKHLERLLQKLDKVFGPNVFRFTEPGTARFFVYRRSAEFHQFIQVQIKAGLANPELAPMLPLIAGLNGDFACHIDGQKTPRSELDNSVVHGYGHMLIARVGRHTPLIAAWLTEGFGAYCEILELSPSIQRMDFTQSHVHCTNYEIKDQKFTDKWPPELAKAIRAGKDTPLGELFGRELHLMPPIEHYQSRALVFFLIYGDGGRKFPGKFLKFLSLLKSGKRESMAIKEAYGLDLKRLTRAYKIFTLKRLR